MYVGQWIAENSSGKIRHLMAYRPGPLPAVESYIEKWFFCHRLIDQYALSTEFVGAMLEGIASALSPFLLAPDWPNASESMNAESARIVASIISARIPAAGTSYRWTAEEDL